MAGWVEEGECRLSWIAEQVLPSKRFGLSVRRSIECRCDIETKFQYGAFIFLNVRLLLELMLLLGETLSTFPR